MLSLIRLNTIRNFPPSIFNKREKENYDIPKEHPNNEQRVTSHR